MSLTRAGEDYNYIDASVDGGANSCSWLPANENKPEADKVQAITVTEQGGLVVELKVQSMMKGCRSVTRTVRLVAGQPWVETTNVVDKLPLLDKDGIHFGFGFNVPQGVTKVDIPWGIMEVEERPVAASQPQLDGPATLVGRFERHSWCDMVCFGCPLV